MSGRRNGRHIGKKVSVGSISRFTRNETGRTLEGPAEKTRGVPDTRATDRASWFQRRKGKRMRDRIANIRWMVERAREHQQDLYGFH